MSNGNNAGTALATRSTQDLAMPAMTIEDAHGRRNELVTFVKQIMQDGLDYGTIPGTDKKTLLKPGAEKLVTFFGLSVDLTEVRHIEDWTGKDHGGEMLFYYVYRCTISRNGKMLVASDASCNSWDGKYRWRWVPASEVSPTLDLSRLKAKSGTIREFDFAIRKAETGGKWGKPAEYWNRFQQAIASGAARKTKVPMKDKMVDAWEIGETMYRVPNEDVAGLINTLQKMAEKRAYVGSAIMAINASDYFTQDMEDVVEIEQPHKEPTTDYVDAGPAEDEYKVDTNGEPILTDDFTFFSEWDSYIAARKPAISRERGRNYLYTMMKADRHASKCQSAEWRLKVLNMLANGDFDMALNPPPKTPEQKPAEPPKDEVIDVKTDPVKAEKPAPPAQPSTPSVEFTRNDMIDPAKFMVAMSEVLPEATIGDVTAAANAYASSIRKGQTYEQMTPDARYRVYQAAKDGRFVIPGGTIVPPRGSVQ